MSLVSAPGNPTTFLPPLARIEQCSPSQITSALVHLRLLYRPVSAAAIPSQNKPTKVHHLIHDDSVPDSGYASESEQEDEPEEQADEDDLDIIRADAFERTFAINWLTSFIMRSDAWIGASTSEDEEERYALLDDITSLLSAFTGHDKPEEAITRKFSFPLANGDGVMHVEMNDEPLASTDHTSVGLQSWASAIVLSQRMCANPAQFGLGSHAEPLRVLELGAGTGLVSIVAQKLLPSAEVIATDYHPDVLANCIINVNTNFPSSSAVQSVAVHALDWEHPDYSPPFDSRFEIILAADVVYHPDHARWIKPCVEKLLLRPSPVDGGRGGTFWMNITLRSTGRHEGLSDMVDEVFPRAEDIKGTGAEWKLGVLSKNVVERQQGMGRVDEGGYKLFEIQWVQC